MRVSDFAHYHTVPLEELTVAELTDALGVAASSKLLGVSARNIYTVRNTNLLGVDRMQQLIAAIRANEAHYRERLILVRMQRERRIARNKTQSA